MEDRQLEDLARSPVVEDFVSREKREFKVKIGWFIASALSGFVAGVIATSIIWFTVIYITKDIAKALSQ